MALFFCLLFMEMALGQTGTNAPDSLGLPGDNFNLSAVLFKFQQCKTLEEFERELNNKDNQINNLDLNNDNEADYIKVEDYVDGNTHAISMKASLSKTETQDVAVIIVQKDASGNISVQVIGDENLYGKDYIIAPQGSGYAKQSKPSETPNPGYKPSKSDTSKSNNGQNVTINNYYTTNNNTTNNNTPVREQELNSNLNVSVGFWPMWGFIYGASYVVYASPYYYGYYPGWYNPYQPMYYHNYYMYHRRAVYYNHYAYNHHYHNNYYPNSYYPIHRQTVNNINYRPRNSGQNRPAKPSGNGIRPGSPANQTRPGYDVNRPTESSPNRQPSRPAERRPNVQPPIPSQPRPSKQPSKPAERRPNAQPPIP
ncbi:MAG: hypothetical protein SGJ00_14420 [bacterium]|nr:hypothetical protein [bacterium]